MTRRPLSSNFRNMVGAPALQQQLLLIERLGEVTATKPTQPHASGRPKADLVPRTYSGSIAGSEWTWNPWRRQRRSLAFNPVPAAAKSSQPEPERLEDF